MAGISHSKHMLSACIVQQAHPEPPHCEHHAHQCLKPQYVCMVEPDLKTQAKLSVPVGTLPQTAICSPAEGKLAAWCLQARCFSANFPPSRGIPLSLEGDFGYT